MKTCTVCKIEKSDDDFYKSKRTKDGLNSDCKMCRLERNKIYVDKNKKEVKDRAKKHRETNKEKIKQRKKEYYEKNKDIVLDRNKNWRDKNSDYMKEYSKEYINKNKEILKDKKKEYRNKEENKIRQKNWWLEHPNKKKEYYIKYSKSDNCKKDRLNWHASFKQRCPHVLAWRSVLNNTLKRLGTKKELKTIDMLGYSALELKEHIENQFIDGMSWNNYGEWHIDHIKMVSTFDENTDIKIVNSLENLRPLWKSDNCSRKFN